MQVLLTNYTPDPEGAIIRAAANCWQSVPREEILDHIIKAGHWTLLEFATFNFEISGVSRSLTHQLVRKRVGVAFAQESQRYVKYDEGFDYVTPPSIKNHPKHFTYCGLPVQAIYNRAMMAAQAAYEQLIELGIPAEDARFVLPNACCSTIHVSINYHALVDLAKERLCGRAQWEIRELVGRMKEVIQEVSPKLAGYMQPKCYWLQRCPEVKSCGLGGV